jgi:dihydrofolate reductase
VRTLIVVEYMSLDEVIQAPGYAGEDPDGGFAHGGWTGPFMAEHRRYDSRLFPTAGAFLLGRRTYEIFAASWPKVTDSTDRIAHALDSRAEFVASTTAFEPAWVGDHGAHRRHRRDHRATVRRPPGRRPGDRGPRAERHHDRANAELART